MTLLKNKFANINTHKLFYNQDRVFFYENTIAFNSIWIL